MVTALEIVRHHGVALRLDGDRLLARGHLTDELRALIRDHKPELVAALRGDIGSPHLPLDDLPWAAAKLRVKDDGRAIAAADLARAFGFPALRFSRTHIAQGPRAWAAFVADASAEHLGEAIKVLQARDKLVAR